MILIERKKKNKAKNLLNKFFAFYFFISIFLIVILFSFIFSSYSFIQIKKNYLYYFSKAGRYEYLYFPNIAFKAMKSYFYKIDKIDLKIDFEDVIKIENYREKAIETQKSIGGLGMIDQVPRVNINITNNGKKYRGEARLKGDRKIHWEDKEKSSYKINLDRNQYLFGMRKFSIQKPRVRNYIHEWIFHQMAKDFNIIKLNYKFINLSINGDDKGLYVLEEGFGKELIERNKRRNGPIFGINEDISLDFNEPVFEIYNKRYWEREENIKVVNSASEDLRKFFQGKIDAKNIFDLEKWAAYFAVMDLTQTYHAAFIKSTKFYFNPINGLFEPIPFDGHRQTPNYHKYNYDYDERILIDIIKNPKNSGEMQYSWIKKFFYDNDKNINKEFYNKYLKYLNKITSKKYFNNFMAENENQIKLINSKIYADYFYYDGVNTYGPGLYYFLPSDYMQRLNIIRGKLSTNKKIQVLKKNKFQFLVKNHYTNYNPFLIKYLVCEKNNKFFKISINKPSELFSDTFFEVIDKKIIASKCTDLVFLDKINNQTFSIKLDTVNSKHEHKNFRYSSKKNSHLNNYFVNLKNKLYLINDEVVIDKNLFIPSGFEVIVKPSQKIILINNAFIISNSPWFVDGEDKIIFIQGQKDNFGGGILITDTDQESIFKNVKFSYLNGVTKKYLSEDKLHVVEIKMEYIENKNNTYKQNLSFKKEKLKEEFSSYLIMGAININNSKAFFKNVLFERISSEDALNIFGSMFRVEDLIFSESASDAIDIDFSNGVIKNSTFKNVNNDGIDLSGSNVNISNIFFTNVGDKLISVGENSNSNINFIKGQNSFVGIAAKDGSIINASNISMKNVKIPFSSYQKKKEYNFPKMNISNLELEEFHVKWLKDQESNLVFEKKM